jgi:hypothetical protein
MPGHYNKKFKIGGPVKSSGGGSSTAAKSSSGKTIPSGIKPSTLPTKTKAVQQYSSPIGPKALSNKAQMMQRAQLMKKENEKNKNNKNKRKHEKVLTADTSVVDPVEDIVSSPGSSGEHSSVIQNQELPSIKIPEKDNVLSLTNSNIDVAEITALVFEKLGAVELTKFTRTDTVEGNNPYYNIISNLSSIRKEFDPSNLISSQKSDTSLYNAFSIKLSTKIPDENYLEEKSLDDYIFIDNDGSLVIELINITPDELIEIEIDTNGTIVEVR